MNRARRTAAALSSLVLLGSALSACDSQPAVCDDVDALQQSVDDLESADVGENGLSAVTNALDDIRTDLRQLGDDASAQYESQIDGVGSSLTDLQSSVAEATSTPSATTLSQVRTDISAFVSSVGDLTDAVSGTC